MRRTRLGKGGPEVSEVGLGCMGMSDFYGTADEAESRATIRAALDAGVTLLDTGDFYGMGHNELLIREALQGVPRDRVFIAVKFGALRDPSGAFVGFDSRPANVRAYLAYSLRRLGTDHVDLYQPARVDPAVPIEDTIGAIAAEKEATPAQLAIAWVRSRGDDIIPLVGARRRDQLAESLAALELTLAPQDLARIEAAVPEQAVAGTRYDAHSMGMLDGER